MNRESFLFKSPVVIFMVIPLSQRFAWLRIIRRRPGSLEWGSDGTIRLYRAKAGTLLFQAEPPQIIVSSNKHFVNAMTIGTSQAMYRLSVKGIIAGKGDLGEPDVVKTQHTKNGVVGMWCVNLLKRGAQQSDIEDRPVRVYAFLILVFVAFIALGVYGIVRNL
jgi:hypothetical protein